METPRSKSAANSNGHSERANVVLLHRVAKLQVLGTFDVQESGTAPDHEDLADFFLQREFAQRFFRPLVAAFRVDEGLRGFLFGENGR
jgi:hypothetical protein